MSFLITRGVKFACYPSLFTHLQTLAKTRCHYTMDHHLSDYSIWVAESERMTGDLKQDVAVLPMMIFTNNGEVARVLFRLLRASSTPQAQLLHHDLQSLIPVDSDSIVASTEMIFGKLANQETAPLTWWEVDTAEISVSWNGERHVFHLWDVDILTIPEYLRWLTVTHPNSRSLNSLKTSDK